MKPVYQTMMEYNFYATGYKLNGLFSERVPLDSYEEAEGHAQYLADLWQREVSLYECGDNRTILYIAEPGREKFMRDNALRMFNETMLDARNEVISAMWRLQDWDPLVNSIGVVVCLREAMRMMRAAVRHAYFHATGEHLG